MEFSVNGKKILNIIGRNFLPLVHLHCSSCFILYVHFRSFWLTLFTQMPSLVLWNDTRKLHVRIVVPKLQSLFLPVTRRVLLLEHCIVPNVPISPQNPKKIWITTLLRSTVPQNLMLPSNVNFDFKIFQDFTLYVNIETLNTECKSDQKQKMWMSNI